MSEPVIDAKVETIADPTTHTTYAWLTKLKPDYEPYLMTAQRAQCQDALEVARLHDPRKNNPEATAVLVRIQVPLSELRRRRDG